MSTITLVRTTSWWSMPLHHTIWVMGRIHLATPKHRLQPRHRAVHNNKHQIHRISSSNKHINNFSQHTTKHSSKLQGMDSSSLHSICLSYLVKAINRHLMKMSRTPQQLSVISLIQGNKLKLKEVKVWAVTQVKKINQETHMGQVIWTKRINRYVIVQKK